jgi:HSP20 family protein
VPMEAVDVSVDADVLTIRGEKRCERKDERACVSERYYGSFQRAIQLPFEPDPDKIQANFENGVLKIALPKQDQPTKAHKIQVSTKEGGNGAKSVRSSPAFGAENG